MLIWWWPGRNHFTKRPFVPLGATVDQILLDPPEVFRTCPFSNRPIDHEPVTGACEGRPIVQADDVAGGPRFQEVGLAAAVVADDRQTARHGLEKDQPEPFVLAGRDEGIGHAQQLEFLGLADVTKKRTRSSTFSCAACLRSSGSSGPSPTTRR